MRRISLPLLLSGAAFALLALPAVASDDPGTMGPSDNRAEAPAGPDAYDGDARRMDVAVDLPDETPADVAQLAQSGAPVTTLPDALRLAYWTAPDLLAQRASLKGVDYRVPQARAGYGPKLDFQATQSYVRSDKDAFGIFVPKGIYHGFSNSAAAVLTQPLFTFGRNFAAERTALAQRAYQAQALRSIEQQALLDALSAYVGLLRDRAAVAIAQDNLDTLQSELSDNQARFKVHEVTATDVQQVITRAELGRAQLYAAQRDAASSEAAFVQKIGGPAGTLGAPNPLDLPVRTLEEAYAYAEGHNPVLLAAHERERVSRASLAAVKADLMPRVDFRGTALYGNQSQYDNNARNRELRGEVTVSGPIYESGLRQAKVGEAIAANDSDWRLIDAALRDNRAGLAASWNDWKAQEAAIERYGIAVDSAQKALDGAKLQERAGLITTLDVLELTRELLSARSAYNTAIASAYVSQARALALMGALEQRWLLPDDPLYDPQVHFNRVKHHGDIPLFTPVMRALDGLTVGPAQKRALRDPATKVETPAVKLSTPAP
jgi:outer membrane protein